MQFSADLLNHNFNGFGNLINEKYHKITVSSGNINQ